MVYFHGMPGTGEELTLCADDNWQKGIAIILPDRQDQYAGDFDKISASLKAQFLDATLHFVGFSMGGFVALQVASRLGPTVSRIDLISAAAPLELGNFLPQMAGKMIFSAARRSRFQFHVLVRLQALLAIAAPDLLYNILFKNVTMAERRLADDPEFKASVSRMTRVSLFRNRSSYIREILAYVQPWAAILPKIKAETFVWHGADDTWAPVNMAHPLAAALPNVVATNIIPGKSHYSCLIEALPLIAADVAKARVAGD